MELGVSLGEIVFLTEWDDINLTLTTSIPKGYKNEVEAGPPRSESVGKDGPPTISVLPRDNNFFYSLALRDFRISLCL